MPDHVAAEGVEEKDAGEGRGQDGVVVQVLPPDAGSAKQNKIKMGPQVSNREKNPIRQRSNVR